MPSNDACREQLRRRVSRWAERLKATPRSVRVQRMTRKWGSCSSRGVITIAEDLARQPPGFQDFVIAHELLHLRVPDHGKVFKALMSVHVPDWRKHDGFRLASGETKATRSDDSMMLPSALRNGSVRPGVLRLM